MALPISRSLSQAVRPLLRFIPVKVRWIALIALFALAAVASSGLLQSCDSPENRSKTETPVGDGETSFLFCTWNVENLFDDKKDKRNSIDTEYDTAYAENETLRELKYDRIAGTLLKMNDGKGPDIIACMEVESVRAAELLQGALNKKLFDAKADDKLQYKNVAMKNLNGGRHIAPCLITRLPITPQLTRMHGQQLRILECHVNVNGHDLCILASHWTSQLKQRDGTDGDSGREKYAVAIYEAFREINKKNIDCDFLVCGDFNDSPDAEPIVKVLGAIGDKTKVKPTDKEPFFLNLMAGKDAAKFGTIWYGGKPLIYDQICVSPGLLDNKGWSADPDSVATISAGLMRTGATRREPFRFGNPAKDMKDTERGFSDHFPVVVKLKVDAKAESKKE